MSSQVRDKITNKMLEEESVDTQTKKACLQTAIYEVTLKNPFLGSVLQCLDIEYLHVIPTAGIMFDGTGKKWKMAINPWWFCKVLQPAHRIAVMLHELYHVTHKHPMRVPFLKLNPKRRHLMNIAMDMAINQYIKNLPAGCNQCPPIEEQHKGERCPNKMCPGHCIDVNHYNDVNSTGKKTPWQAKQTAEYYYEKLIQMFTTPQDDRPKNHIAVVHIFTTPIVVTPRGAKDSKQLTSTNSEDLLAVSNNLKVGDQVAVVAQDDPVDNGVYTISDLGSNTTQYRLTRYEKMCGTLNNPVYTEDGAYLATQKVAKDGKMKIWAIIGEARSEDSNLVLVDRAPMIFEEKDAQADGGEGGDGLPQEFDSHQWDGSAEESEMLDATEELVKRAMQKQGLDHSQLPQFAKDLLDDIEARRSELNYKALLLSAIKKHASGVDREHSWTRRSRRWGIKSPGTRIGPMPALYTLIDTSGSISVQEANEFLDVIDNFLKIGTRKCDLALWHTQVYHNEPYRLGDRVQREIWQSGGTCLEDTLKHIYKKKADLNIILTDGCYSDIDVESWLKPGEKFPQILWIISRDGREEHPIVRLGATIKIPNTDLHSADRRIEEQ